MPRRKRARPREAVRLVSDREQALFEAGIKLGGLFHQFIGTPVSPRTSRGLAQAIEAAVGLQPFVGSVRVSIDPLRGGRTGAGRFGYRYLTAEMIEARLEVRVGGSTVRAHLSYREDLHYPLMRAEEA